MPTYQIKKNGKIYSKTADTQEEAIAAVMSHIETQTAAFDEADAQLDALDGPQVEATPRKEIERTFSDYADAVGAMISGVGGQIIGSTFGFGKGLYNAVQDGTYGTQEGVANIRGTMDEVTDQFSRDVYTEGGADVLNSVGEVLEPLTRSDQLGALAAAIPTQPTMAVPGMISRQAARATAGDIADAAVDSAKAVAALPGQAGRAALSPITVPARAIRDRVYQPPVNPRSVGAAEVEKARQRQATAQTLPSPFEGDSQLTRGQLTRDNEQIGTERELAKNNAVGKPMQERISNQQGNMHRNFGLLEEEIDAQPYYGDVEQGAAVRGAVDEYRQRRKKEKDDAYAIAEEAGEMSAIVPAETLKDANLTEVFQDAWHKKGVIQPNEPVFQEARRLNIIDDQGNLKNVNAAQLKELREFVNMAYDPKDGRHMRQRRFFVNAIDQAMDTIDAGPAYREARRVASAYYDEFDNSPLANDIGSKKRGSNVEKVADERIPSKVFNSSVQEIEQLKTTLMNSGERGQTEWRGLQARFLKEIEDSAFGNQTDSRDTTLITASKFKSKVRALDRSGKLEVMLGPKQAQNIRDLVEIADAIATVPPGTVNHSNTTSAFINKLQSVLGYANPKTAFVGGLFNLAGDAAKVKRSLDGQGLLEVEVSK